MAQMLLSQIQNHRTSNAEEVIRPELVIRESAPLPSGQDPLIDQKLGPLWN